MTPCNSSYKWITGYSASWQKEPKPSTVSPQYCPDLMEWVGGELLNRNERNILIKICNWSETWTHKTWLSYFLLCWSVPSLRCSWKSFSIFQVTLTKAHEHFLYQKHLWFTIRMAFPEHFPTLISCALYFCTLWQEITFLFLLTRQLSFCSVPVKASNFLDWLSKSLT